MECAGGPVDQPPQDNAMPCPYFHMRPGVFDCNRGRSETLTETIDSRLLLLSFGPARAVEMTRHQACRAVAELAGDEGFVQVVKRRNVRWNVVRG